MAISVLSKEYLLIPLTSNVVPEELSTPEVGFSTSSIVGPTTWHPATFEANQIKLLVGPGAIELTPGDWLVWVRVTDTPEIPVEAVGTVRFY